MTKEEISARQQQAAQFHAMGYNCAQSVACAFADKVDLDKVALFKVTEGLGLGMGGMNGTCGAISAAAVLAGLKDSTGDLELANRRRFLIRMPESASRVSEKNQSVVCRDLKGGNRKCAGVPVRTASAMRWRLSRSIVLIYPQRNWHV